MVRKFLKLFLPPVIFRIYTGLFKKVTSTSHYQWEGNYTSWDEAYILCKGYSENSILEKVRDSMLKVKQGLFPYERDSVLFNEIQYSWPVLATFLKIASENNNALNIIDFGGSLGSSYFQNRLFLKNLKDLKWNIVEQKQFVLCGKQFFEDESLKFYDSFKACVVATQSKVLFVSSVLQYLENPDQWIAEILQYDFDYIILDRTAFIENEKDRLTLQTVPATIYTASYPAWFFNKEKLTSLFAAKYDSLYEFNSYCDSPTHLSDKTQVFWKGLVFKRIINTV